LKSLGKKKATPKKAGESTPGPCVPRAKFPRERGVLDKKGLRSSEKHSGGGRKKGGLSGGSGRGPGLAKESGPGRKGKKRVCRNQICVGAGGILATKKEKVTRKGPRKKIGPETSKGTEPLGREKKMGQTIRKSINSQKKNGRATKPGCVCQGKR